jgi:hypothetical protein
MGKLGVGVGDDFPIDEGKGPTNGPQNDPDYEKQREEWRRQREEWHRSREEWRERRRQWRDAWRQKKREFRAEMKARYGDAYDDDHHHHWHYDSHQFMRVIAIVGLVAVTIMIFSHIYMLFGLLVLAGLYFAYRGGFDHFDFPHHAGPPAPPAPPSDAPKA